MQLVTDGPDQLLHRDQIWRQTESSCSLLVRQIKSDGGRHEVCRLEHGLNWHNDVSFFVDYETKKGSLLPNYLHILTHRNNTCFTASWTEFWFSVPRNLIMKIKFTVPCINTCHCRVIRQPASHSRAHGFDDWDILWYFSAPLINGGIS